MSKLANFLKKNAIGSEENKLPYVHSTRSHNIDKIFEESEIGLSPCPHNNDDPLLYFFKGRPCYRESSDGEEASYWQLPTCFIFETLPSKSVTRTYPFDSGAFAKGLYPKYIKLMDISEFEVKDVDASDRIIEAFFGDIKSYVEGKVKSEADITDEYSISAFDAEILAIRRLAGDGTPKNFDDRRFTVEVQVHSAVNLAKTPPVAVILPLNYMSEPLIRQRVEQWGCEPITYDVHSQSLEVYYGVIFQKFREFCREKGVMI